MPGPRNRPGPDTNRPNGNSGKLSKAQGSASNTSPLAGGTLAESGNAWHDLNMSLARSLPTSLLRAGQLQHGAWLNLKNRAKVR